MEKTSVNHPLDTINFTEVHIGDTVLWFSYKTVIGFYTLNSGKVVRENEWNVTTGKHLNYLTDKKNRLPREKFLELAKENGIEI